MGEQKGVSIEVLDRFPPSHLDNENSTCETTKDFISIYNAFQSIKKSGLLLSNLKFKQ